MMDDPLAEVGTIEDKNPEDDGEGEGDEADEGRLPGGHEIVVHVDGD